MSETPEERIAGLVELNRRLANQVVGYSDRAQKAIRPKLAAAWDQGYKSGFYGTNPYWIDADNPYRQEQADEG